MALRETDAVCELLLRSYNTGVLSRFQTFRTENPRLSTTDAIDLFMESTNTEPDTRTRYLLLDWHNLNPTPATLQCSFCQIPYQSQYIMPLCFSEETDWRNKWVGACYGCATCDTSSVPWFQFEELLADPNSLIAEHAPYNTIAEHPDLAAMISDHTIAPPTLQIAVPETDDAHDAYITVHRWDINEFIDKFCRITRQHQQRLLQVKDSWETFTWQLAMKMRSGATFSKATKELLADTTTMNDILSQPAKKQPRTETRRPQNNSSQFRQPKGRGKNTWGNKGYQTTSYPYNNQPYATWGPTLFANPAIPSMPTTPGPSFKGDTPKGKKGSGKGKKGTKSHGKNKAR